MPPNPTIQATRSAAQAAARTSPRTARRTKSIAHGTSSKPKKLVQPRNGAAMNTPLTANAGAAGAGPERAAAPRRAAAEGPLEPEEEHCEDGERFAPGGTEGKAEQEGRRDESAQLRRRKQSRLRRMK